MMCLMTSWDPLAKGAFFSAARAAPSPRAPLLQQEVLADQPLTPSRRARGNEAGCTGEHSVSQSQRPWNRLDMSLGRQSEVHLTLKASVAYGEAANLPLESLGQEYATAQPSWVHCR